jgi:hypothetical protein
MIIGAHVILYSTAAEADRAFLLELLGTRHVDAGGGWLMCDDIDKTVVDLAARGVTFDGGVHDRGWGLWTSIQLPSGGTLGLYQPRHPIAAGAIK